MSRPVRIQRKRKRDRVAFDPSKPFDLMADMFRRQIAEMVLEAGRVGSFRDLPAHTQVECMVAGILTGLIITSFAHFEPSGRDAVMAAIKQYLPFARQCAEELIANAPGDPQ